MQNTVFLIFPNQLFESTPQIIAHHKPNQVFLIEEPIYFYDPIHKPYKVNKIKVAYLRACMKAFYANNQAKLPNLTYIDYHTALKSANYSFIPLTTNTHLVTFDPIDYDLKEKLPSNVIYLDSPDFLIPLQQLKVYFDKHPKATRHTSFYTFMKTQLGGNLLGNFVNMQNLDAQNRHPPPKNPPHNYRYKPPKNLISLYAEAIQYAHQHFPTHHGEPENVVMYPITSKEARKSLNIFLKHSLPNFGKYQDAAMQQDPFMYHSILSPSLNNGLLTPRCVVETTMKYVKTYNNPPIPLSSLEGFLRQIIGWRAYMQGLYLFRHKELTSQNLPKNQRRLKGSQWYTGTTGITPLDKEIKKALKYGYAHHIVRLMIFMNFFILSQIHPSDIIKWFMEVVSIDAYSWVMESNIYAMGYFTPMAMTKPYISSSHYIARMTNYKKDGHWDKIWDDLYHRFIATKPKEYTFFYKRTSKATELSHE